MGMSTSIYGYRPADEQWRKMKAAWDACKLAGVDPPLEVNKFFDFEDPRDRPGMEVKIERTEAVQEIEDANGDCWQVDVTKLPEGVRFIRFRNSW